MELSVRSYLTAGIALTAASAITFAPLAVPPTAYQPALPQVSAPEIHLAALINHSDVTTLVNNLNAALNSVSPTVTAAFGVPGQTLDSALGSAAALNTSLWDGLISATPSAPLAALLQALKASSNGGLLKLADSVAGANDTLTLTTGQMTALLTSTLTGSLGTALYAVSDVVNNPLALASYTSLLDVPVGIAGTALNSGLAAINILGGGAINLGGSLVHGVTAQISNVIALVNGAADAAKTLAGNDLINGAITAVQGITSAVVTAALAGVDGVTTTITHAATTALSRVTVGAQRVVTDWVGNGTTPGAVQAAINAIGSAPLSPASYSNAVSVLVGAGISTVKRIADTGGSLLSIPVTAAADLTDTAANVITSFNNGLATAASGILLAVGLGPFVAGLPYAMASTVNFAVNAAAYTAKIGLNVIASALDFGSAVTSGLTAASVPSALSARQVISLSATTDSATKQKTDDAEGNKNSALVKAADDKSTADTAEEASASPAADGTQEPSTTTDESTAAAPEAPATSPQKGDTAETTDATSPSQTEPDADTAAPAPHPSTKPTKPTVNTNTDADTGSGTTGAKDATDGTTAAANRPRTQQDSATGSTSSSTAGAGQDGSSTSTSAKPSATGGSKDGTNAGQGGSSTSTSAKPSAAGGSKDGTGTSAKDSGATSTPKHASETSPRHAASDDSAAKHAA